MPQTKAQHRSSVTPVTTRERILDKPFPLSEFLGAVQQDALYGRTDPRLVHLRAASGQGESTPTDGGFAMPSPVVDRLYTSMTQASPLLSRVTTRTVTVGNTYRGILPSEPSRADGSRHGGIIMAGVDEGTTLPYTQTKVRRLDMSLTKFGTVAAISNELMADTTVADDLLNIVEPETRFAMERNIWNGLGGAMPVGVVNAPALVTVLIEATQSIANTTTFLAKNAAKMLRQQWNIADCAFFMHPDLLVSVLTATTGGTQHTLVGEPSDVAPYGTLFTRPMFPLEVAPAEGTVGDFVCASMSDYLLVTKGTLQSTLSTHVRFLQDEGVFKFTVRFNGQPMLSQPITPFTGSNKLSTFVALAARA